MSGVRAFRPRLTAGEFACTTPGETDPAAYLSLAEDRLTLKPRIWSRINCCRRRDPMQLFNGRDIDDVTGSLWLSMVGNTAADATQNTLMFTSTIWSHSFTRGR